jgi:hypothetical protein
MTAQLNITHLSANEGRSLWVMAIFQKHQLEFVAPVEAAPVR